jgi:hypothetical protein
VPTLRVHVRADDWNRSRWREQFETDLAKTGWRIVAVEEPGSGRADSVYVVTLERAPGESAGPASGGSTSA